MIWQEVLRLKFEKTHFCASSPSDFIIEVRDRNYTVLRWGYDSYRLYMQTHSTPSGLRVIGSVGSLKDIIKNIGSL